MAEEHYAEIRERSGDFRVEFKGTILAKSESVQELQEYHPSYEFPPVLYFPQSSLRFDQMEKSDRETSCPIKGKAAYWNLSKPEAVENLVWSYPNPLTSVPQLKDHYAFDSSEVEIFRDGAKVEHRPIRKR